MKALKLWLIVLGLCVGGSLAQFQVSSSYKPITFEDVLRQLLGLRAKTRSADRIMNSQTAAKLREALDDSDITPEVTSTNSGSGGQLAASKPSRFDGILRTGAEPEEEDEKQDDLSKGDAESEESKEATDLKPEVTKADSEKEIQSSFPDKKWKKPSRFDGSYDELMQDWKLKQAAILKTATASKKQAKPEVSPAPSSRILSLQPSRPHRRQKRFFFSWPGSFESPWPESERSNTFISSDPTVVQAQQIFRLFSNSFFNGFREMMQGMFRLRPADDEKKTEESSASSSSSAENELRKRTITGRMASKRNRNTRLQNNKTTKRPRAQS